MVGISVPGRNRSHKNADFFDEYLENYLDLFRVLSGGSPEELGEIINFSSGDAPPFGWSIQFAVDEASGQLYYTVPAAVDGSNNQVLPGSIGRFDLATLGNSTFITNIDLPNGLAIGSNGSVYFGNLDRDLTTLELFEVTSGSQILSFGDVFATAIVGTR